MQVCFLTSVHNVWDTRIYHREAKSLAMAGYHVTIIATGFRSQETPIANIKLIGLRRFGWRIGRALNWAPFIKAALKTNADIYHFHDPDLLFVGVFLKFFTKKPVIYDNHDPYVEAILQREWLPQWLRPIVSRLFGFLEKLLSCHLSAVIIANPAQQARFPNAILIHNYPDLEAFKISSNRKITSARVIHAGTLTEARGVFEIIEIARLLAHREVKFVLLGPFANNRLEREIKNKVQQLNLQHLIEFEGRVAHERIVNDLMNAAIGLVAFRAVPNHLMIIPTKLFEYMACGLPVVAPDLPPIRSYITRAKCGLLVPPEDPQASAEAVEYLLDHLDEAQQMGLNGRQAVLKYYNWGSEGQKLLSLYQKLLN